MSRPPESGSGEPVPAPTLPYCLRCGWEPIEGMTRYREIHGDEAKCLRCRESLVGQVDPYAASPGGEPPTPDRAEIELLRTSRDALREALTRIGEGHGSLCCGKGDCGEQIAAFARAALLGDVPSGSARPPLPPQEISPEMVDAAHRLLGPDLHRQQVTRALRAALRVRGEPSREPTLEEIAREAVTELERIRQSVNKRYPQSGLHGTADFLVGELMSAVLLTFAPLRARLSSPEAPPESRGSVPSPTPTKEP